jgi:hypothetical protein
MKNSTPWHSMKLVVLGNGRIGKTTLLHTMFQLLKKVCGVNGEKIIIIILIKHPTGIFFFFCPQKYNWN